MDMMRPISVAVPPTGPYRSIVSAIHSAHPAADHPDLDGQLYEQTGFTVRRALTSTGPWTTLIDNLAANTTTYVDILGSAKRPLYYQVIATNTVGYSFTPPGYMNLSTSGASAITLAGTLPALPPSPPSLLTAVPETGPRARQTWRDNANNEAGFVVERRLSGGVWALLAEVAAKAGSGTSVTYLDLTVSPP